MKGGQYRQFLLVIAILSFFLVALLAFDTAASAAPAGDAQVRILVKAPPGQSAAELAEQLPERIAPRPRGFLAKLTVRKASAESVKVKHVLKRTGWVAMEVPASSVEKLVEQGYQVQEDKQIHALLVDSVPLINATQVWALRDANGDNVTGRGITIAILDTGINYSHPDLGGCTQAQHLAGNCKVLPGYDYVNDDTDAADDHLYGSLCCGHGTHVAGIAAANGTLKGVAPDATLVAYKVLGNNGIGDESDAVAAIENATDAGYDVISISFGGGGNADDAMSSAVDDAVEAGVVVVVSAGNSGPSGSTIGSPGTARLAITVGNTNDNDALVSSSSRGPNPYTYEIKPELTAPGSGIVSTSINSPSTSKSGTSMSCPHVSGAAALIKQLHPDWSSIEIKAALVGTAKDLGLDVTDQGAGRIRVLAAANASFVSLSSQLSLGVQSLPLANVTAYLNLSELSNATYNVSLTASLRTGSTTVELNASTVQLSALGNASVRFVISLTGTDPAIYSGLITVNSSVNNISIPFWLQTQDTVPPAWSGNVTGIPATYSSTTSSIFNITWTDLVNMHTVLLESNFSGSPANYTMGNITNTTYNFSQVLPAGSHYWKSYANDTSNNKNRTGSWGFSIARATPTLTITNNTPGNTTYGSVTNVTCAASSEEVMPVLYRNNSNITNSEAVLLAAGTWAFTCNSSQTANYTAATAAQLNITVIKAVPTLNLTLNGTAGNMAIGDCIAIWLNGSVVRGDGGAILTLYLDGASKGSGASVSNLTTFATPGTFNISLNYTATQNYTAGMASYLVTVSDITPPSVTNLVPIAGTHYFNDTAITISADITDNVNISAVWANVTWANGSLLINLSNSTSLTYSGQFSNTSETGVYNVTFFANDTTNNLNSSETTWFNVTVLPDTTPPSWANVSATPSSPANYSASTTQRFNVSWSDAYSLLTVLIEHNFTGTLTNYSVIAHAESVYYYDYGPIAVGSYVWRMYANDSSGNANRTDQYPYNVTKATPVLNLTLNGTAGNVTISQASSIWLNGSVVAGDGGGLIEIFLDGTEIGVGTTVANLTNFSSIGLFNITLYYTETGNYTTTTATHFVTVVDATAPTVSSHTPTGTVTSSSTTLTAVTDENATCRYSATAGTAYASMASVMSGTGTSHTAGLTGLSTGTYHYYIRCNDTAGNAASTDYDAGFTVSISTGGGGGGGGSVGITTTADTAVSTTQVIASVSEAKGVDLHISKESIPVNKIEVAVTGSATNVEIQVSATDEKPESVVEPPRGSGGAERTVYKYLEIEHKNLEGKIKEATLEFKVAKAWLADNEYDKSQVVLQRHTGAGWEELETAISKETAGNVYYRATSAGFSVFAITVKETEEAQPVAVAEEAPEGQPLEPPVEPPAEPPAEPPEQPPVQPPSKAIFQLAFTIAVATILASTGLGYIYKNRLTMGARIDEMLERLGRHRERRERRK